MAYPTSTAQVLILSRTNPAMSTRKLIVLIVDDTPLIVKRETEMLRELEEIGSILQAGSFSEAISVLKETAPDISGIELLQVCKSEYPSITVIMLTNQGNVNYKDLCRRLGADHFIDKSKEFDLLPDIIANYISGRT